VAIPKAVHSTKPWQLHLPNRKVSAGALTGALTVLLVAVLNKYLATPVPAEVSSAIMTILSFAATYWILLKTD